MTTELGGDDRKKRALADLPAPTKQSGEPALSRILFEALARASREDPDAITHGFHVYPARMHRSIAAHLLDAFAHPDAPTGVHVVDPFCGSGTVLVEARVRGLASTGVDLSPLALRLAEIKTTVRSAEERARLATTADLVVTRTKERVRKRDAARAPISKEEAQRYAPHVLRELAVLLDEIRRVEVPADRGALELVLSSLLTKLSLRRSETDERVSERRIGRFIPTEMFGKKCFELVGRMGELADATRADAKVTLIRADMRSVRLSQPATLIVTSPPYGGTYDYARHHEGRMEWLGLDGGMLEKHEMGARRRMERAPARAWDAEVQAMLSALVRMLAPDGRACVLLGDGEVGGRAAPADVQLDALAPGAGLRVLARASAPRAEWRRSASPAARFEHLALLARA